MRAAFDRPRLWRATAALAALLLAGLVLVCAQGSLTIIAKSSRRRTALPRPPLARRLGAGLERDR
jgi:hypothetical protein